MPRQELKALQTSLEAVVKERIPGASGVEGLRRLSGGASQETWSFDAHQNGAALPLILRRRARGPAQEALGGAISLELEAELLSLAADAKLPVPAVRCILVPTDELGSGFLMERLAGETIPQRIFRDEALAEVRPRLARQCGQILAGIHGIARDALPELPFAPADAQLEQYRGIYDRFDDPHPVFELAFRWIEENLPEPGKPSLVHGDFRNGNLMIDARGIRGVLDWELAHVGDPMEDLGWICVNSWRFGHIDFPVGGFGSREELAQGYESAGGDAVNFERVRFWEVVGSLKWGIICTMMLFGFRHGPDRSVERAAIGRRASETEIDLLELIAP
jgi:aminoglycoside phosphotransferase (APT) family kinase protein